MSKNTRSLPPLDVFCHIMIPELMFASYLSPSCLSFSLCWSVCCLGALQSTTQKRRDQRQGAFYYPPPQPHHPTSTTSSSSSSTFFHWLLMLCKESPGALTPSLQLSLWPQCSVPTLYPDVRRMVKGRKVQGPLVVPSSTLSPVLRASQPCRFSVII